MKNYIQDGNIVPFTVPAGGAVGGVPLVIGALVVVPAFTAAEGELCEGATGCVYEFAKLSTDTPTQFSKAYWDATNARVTTTATANTLIGVFMDALATGTTVANVRLSGVAV